MARNCLQSPPHVGLREGFAGAEVLRHRTGSATAGAGRLAGRALSRRVSSAASASSQSRKVAIFGTAAVALIFISCDSSAAELTPRLLGSKLSLNHRRSLRPFMPKEKKRCLFD